MKTFIKSLLFTALGMALIIGVQSKNMSFQDVLAQITGQFVKPTTIPLQRTTRTSNEPELNNQIKYAIPIGVDLFSLVGSIYSNASIDSAINGYQSARAIPLPQDVNGDGLPDMIFSYNTRDYSNVLTTEQYVMLNNGQGYDLVYACSYKKNTAPYYTGDCAK